MLNPTVRLFSFYLPENPGTRSYFVQCSAARNCYQVWWTAEWEAARGAEDGGREATAADAEEEPRIWLSDPAGENGALAASPPGENDFCIRLVLSKWDSVPRTQCCVWVWRSSGVRHCFQSKINHFCFLQKQMDKGGLFYKDSILRKWAL